MSGKNIINCSHYHFWKMGAQTMGNKRVTWAHYREWFCFQVPLGLCQRHTIDMFSFSSRTNLQLLSSVARRLVMKYTIVIPGSKMRELKKT